MRQTRSSQIYLLGLFLLAGLAAFSLNLNSYFLSDDFVQIGKVLRGDYAVAWGQEYGGFFRPLFIWSYVIDSHIWGARPPGYHLTNIILHSVNAFLIYRLVVGMVQPLRLTSQTRNMVAIFAPVLFLLHPSHSEAVVWISGRADLIAACFALASLLTYLTYEVDRRRPYLIASLGTFLLALLAKESAICVPFLILLVGIRRSGGLPLGHWIKVLALYFAFLFGFIFVRSRFIGSIVGGYGTAQHLNFSPGWIRDRLLEAMARSIVPPLPISWQSFLFKPLQSPIFYLISLLVVVGIVTAAWARRRLYSTSERKVQNRFLLISAAMFLISLLPVINLRLSLYETLGERFLYLPTVFACLLVAYLATVLVQNRAVLVTLMIIFAAFQSWSLYRTNLLWREAAGLSYSVSHELADSASTDKLIILNVPDNLRGVPVFHNGLSEAVNWYHGKTRVTKIQILAFQDLQSGSDEIVINQNATLTVRALNRADTFSRMASTDCLEVSNRTNDTLNINQKPCATAGEIFFLSGGRINQLQSAGLRPGFNEFVRSATGRAAH